MAGFRALLTALRLAVKRDLGTFRAMKVNNLFLFVALMVYTEAQSGMSPGASAPLILLLCILLLFPISTDPMAQIPASRRLLWPLSRSQWIALRACSLTLSPVFWIVVLILVKTRKPWFAITFLAISFTARGARFIQWDPFKYVPPIPGRLGGLIRNNLRQMFSILDTYAAILLCVGSTLYKDVSPHPDPAAFRVCAVLVAIALSTYAQCLFGLDMQSSTITRYRLLPLKGWQILVAKDAAFLFVLFLLVLPIDVQAGLTFGFASLAIGHHPSVTIRASQYRWRFTGARLLPAFIQLLCALTLTFGGLLWLSVALFCISAWWYGRVLYRAFNTEAMPRQQLSQNDIKVLK